MAVWLWLWRCHARGPVVDDTTPPFTRPPFFSTSPLKPPRPGATLEHRDSNGDTALHHACEAGHLECVRALLARDCPSATSGTDDETIVRAILEGIFAGREWCAVPCHAESGRPVFYKCTNLS